MGYMMKKNLFIFFVIVSLVTINYVIDATAIE